MTLDITREQRSNLSVGDRVLLCDRDVLFPLVFTTQPLGIPEAHQLSKMGWERRVLKDGRSKT